MKSSAAAGAGREGTIFSGVEGWFPRAWLKNFSLVSLTAALSALRIYAIAARTSLSLSTLIVLFYFLAFSFSDSLFVLRDKTRAAAIMRDATRALERAAVVRVASVGRAAAVRCPSRWLLIRTYVRARRLRPKFRARVGAGGEREAATTRARRAAERTLRSGWVGFKAAEG